jgi:hypothetical protein
VLKSVVRLPEKSEADFGHAEADRLGVADDLARCMRLDLAHHRLARVERNPQ